MANLPRIFAVPLAKAPGSGRPEEAGKRQLLHRDLEPRDRSGLAAGRVPPIWRREDGSGKS